MALAASNYRTPAGVVFAEPLEDQVALLDWVDAHVGRPRQVITWGNSGGGVLATLLAERHPDRIDGAIPLCGPLGGIGTQFNLTLDFAFAVRTLLAPGSDLELVRITDPDATAARVDEIVQGAVGTPQGRARLALANALANVVPWARALYPRPDDVTRQVRRAYDEAGLDLERLAAAPRIGADDGAVGWLAQFTPTGRIRVPVLALHATGDGAAVPEHERRYAQQVRHAGDQDLLRQLFTERGGHCAFTPSELIVTIQALRARLQTGRWPATGPADLNAAARALGPQFQVALDWGVTFQPRPADPAFVTYEPGRLPRPFPPAA